MSVERDNPYGTFNYLVDLKSGADPTKSIKAGFQEVTGLNVEVTSSEYRNGNEGVNHTRKVSSMYKVGDITLKRGLMGALDLYQWVDTVRTGDPNAKRNIDIQLRDETGTNTVMTWHLSNAWAKKWTGPSLNAKTGTDVAIEELVLSCDNLTME
jgi:phage tail-like protein